MTGRPLSLHADATFHPKVGSFSADVRSKHRRVSSVSSNAGAGKSHHRSSSAPTHNPQRVNDVAQNKLIVNLEREPDLQMELEKLAPGRVTVWNEAGTTSRLLECGLSKQEEIDEAYQELRELVLQKLGFFGGAQEVNFEFSYTRVRYRLFDGTKGTADLQQFLDHDQDFERAYRAAEELVTPLWGGSLRSQPTESGKKSCSSCPSPMDRKTLALQGLPMLFSDSLVAVSKLLTGASQIEQDTALRRCTAAEIVISSLIKKAKNEIANSAGQQNKIDELNRFIENLEFERLGLYVALAFAPSEPQPPQSWTEEQQAQAVEAAARRAQRALQEYIEKEREKLNQLERRNWPTWIPGWIRNEPIPEEKCYSVDAAALIYSAMPVGLARNALDFWREHKVFQKHDCLEDELVAFAFGQGNIPQLDEIINRVSDPTLTLRNALHQELTNARAAAQTILNPSTAFPATPYISAKMEDRVGELLTQYGVQYGLT